MKQIIIMLLLLIFGNYVKAQNDVDCLYDSLLYSNDVCKKTIDVTYLSFGKNPISQGNDKDDEIRKIKQRISYIPNSSVHFSYKEKEYYISIGDECDMTQYSEGDKIKIDIVFFEDIKQPYKYEKPFSLITSVTDSSSETQYDKITRKNVYLVVEEMPKYKGGEGVFLKELANNIQYVYSENDNIQTRVQVQFVIDKKGQLIGARIYGKESDAISDFEKAVLNALCQTKDWQAGRQNGKPVNVLLTKTINICPNH